MNNFKELIGCRCHANFLRLGDADGRKSKTPGHTFAWAETQYLEERPVVPVHQFLDLRLDMDAQKLDGFNTITIKVVQKEVHIFSVDSIDLDIHDVVLDGKPVSFEVSEKKLNVKPGVALKRGAKHELKISYTCQKPRAGGYFISPDKEYPDRPVQFWTQGQDDDARYWFPCFDEPRLKCSFEMRVEVPTGLVATSNGALMSETKSGSKTIFHWKTETQIPAYLVTLTVGKFAVIKDEWRGKPVTYICEKDAESQAKMSFGKTPAMMELFSNKIGVEYPYEKYAQVAVSEFVFGGMENTSATTQTDATLHPADLDEEFSSDDLVSHELAHQWFGDLVTCKSWTDGWLNEGWATFMETVFKEKDLGATETEYYRFEEFQIYQDEDSGSYRRPIVTDFYSDPAEVWDRHTYQKAGLVLNVLRGELGDEDFWAGTKKYLERHRGGVVQTLDFQRAHEEVSGRSLDWFFDQWIYKSGYPELKATFDWDEKTKIANFKLSQTQKTDDHTPLFKLNSKVEFVFADKSSEEVEIAFKDKEQIFSQKLKEKPLYVRFDKGNTLLKSLEWALPLEMVKAQLAKDTDVVGKVWALKHLTKDATKAGVEALIETLKNDAFWGVRAEAANALGDVKTEAAYEALVTALDKEKKPRVRARIVQALGQWREERAAQRIMEQFKKDKHEFVRANCLSALGRTKSEKAFDFLRDSLKIESWRDLIQTHAYMGLRILRNEEKTLPLFMAGAKYGMPKYARLTAIGALGDVGLNKLEVTDFLKDTLNDRFFRAQFAALEALVRRKDPSALGPMGDLGSRAVDGHLKATAFRAIRRLRAGLEKPAELKELKETLEKIQDENRKLRDRFDKIERKAGSGGKKSPAASKVGKGARKKKR